MNRDWYEVWVDESTDVPYVLFMLPDAARAGGVVIIDPKVGDKVVYAAGTYEEAKLWLLEDEYTRVEGRMLG
jgi:hypothetical protein